MIETITGNYETVNYTQSNILRLHRNNEYEDFQPHWHRDVEMIYTRENIYTLHIGDDDILLQEGDFLIISSGTLHSITAPPTGNRYIMLLKPAYYRDLKDISVFMTSIGSYFIVRKADYPEVSARIAEAIQKIDEIDSSNESFSDSLMLSAVLQLLVILGRLMIQQEKLAINTGKKADYGVRFIEICDYIRKHCSENLTLEQIAAQSGFSKYHFCRLFREMTNTNLHEYLSKCRIQVAKELLNDPNISITEVAMRSGFSSLSTFNRTFKQHLGCTPSEYRSFPQNL